jgi:3-dehydroquinate synthase
MTSTIHIDLAERSYNIHVGAGLIARAGELIAPFAPTKRVFVVTDKTVAKRHGAALEAAIQDAGLELVKLIKLKPGEEAKSYAGLQEVLSELLRAGLNRRDLVIAFGGGVIGDLAGFAAGVVKRGVDFVQIPTTLLAQVDSSVGGKTAIDTPEGKNLVGLVHQPRLVLADTDALATLPKRELCAGYAEIVKIGLICDARFFAWCEQNARALLAGDGEALKHAITTAIGFKVRVVEQDEREEKDIRALLNLGHTFAHALETAADFDLPHGEAVALGLLAALRLSGRDTSEVERELTPEPAHVDPERAWQALLRDKKRTDDAINVVLLGDGGPRVEARPADEVRRELERLIA